MWVFTQDGFISAVDNGESEGKLAVRARDRRSLEMLSIATGAEVIELRGRDYEYRVYVTREEFTEFMANQIKDLDYGNYKSRIWATRGEVFHDACSDVWGAMLQVSDKRVRR
jgi:hypothetical protein